MRYCKKTDLSCIEPLLASIISAMKKPTITAANVIAQSKLFEIEQVDLQFSNGETRQFERVRGRRRGAVMMVPLLDENTVLLVREYAVGVEDYVLTFPKGLLEADEAVEVAANRELMEEVGYGAAKITPLKSMTTAPGYMGRPGSEGMYLVLAEELYPQQASGDEPEPIEVISWRIDQLDQLLARRDFNEARSIAAFFMVRDLINQRRS